MSEPLSGAQFQREVGVDPEKWAAAFLGAYAQADGVRTDADRQAFVAAWFRDAMRAAVGSELMAHWKRDPVDAMRAQREANDTNT